MPAGLPFSAQKRVRRRGQILLTAPAGECVLGWAAALRAAPDQGLARTDVRIVSGLEQACHRCHWGRGHGSSRLARARRAAELMSLQRLVRAA